MAGSKKILIIEDEQAQREALRDKLSLEGYEVFVASDGVKGLAAAIQHKPDLILLDIVMPNVDGISTLKKLREHEWGKKARVIMLSNLSEAHVVLEGEQVDGFLVKSNWRMADLVAKIKDIL